MTIAKSLSLLLIPLALLGCATMPPPRNVPGAQYQPTQQLGTHHAAICSTPPVPAAVSSLRQVPVAELTDAPDRLGAGDRLKLSVSGDTDTLTGSYVVSANGTLAIQDLGTVTAAGRTRAEVEADVRDRLIAGGLVRDVAGNVRLSQAEVAGVRVSVEGAVFQPGLVRVGERVTTGQAGTSPIPANGDYNVGRTLALALRQAGGLRPDAAAQSVYLVWGDIYAAMDLSPAFTGGLMVDPQLAAGDRIFVPSAGCFQPDHVRPTSVTAPDIRVFLSNLSRPATSGRDGVGIPYGTRLLDGLVMANCVGGSAMNARRQAVLISRNPVNGKSVVIARSVEGLVREAGRDDWNPYLLPDDALACYDSRAMALVDAVSVVGSLLSPAILFGIR